MFTELAECNTVLLLRVSGTVCELLNNLTQGQNGTERKEKCKTKLGAFCHTQDHLQIGEHQEKISTGPPTYSPGMSSGQWEYQCTVLF